MVCGAFVSSICRAENESDAASVRAPVASNAKAARDAYDKAPERPRTTKTKLLERAFEATQQQYLSLLESIELLPDGSSDRKRLIERTVASLNADIDYYWAIGGPGGIVLWLEYTIGRAHGAGGDYRRACEEGLDLVIAERTEGHTSGAQTFIDNIKARNAEHTQGLSFLKPSE